MNFDLDIFYSHLVRGKLRAAMDYLRSFPDESARYNKYAVRFEMGERPRFADDALLDDVLHLYQDYYREVFYLETDAKQAADQLREGLSELFGAGSLDELEKGAVKQAFESRGYEFHGGRTGGYYGPYVWKSTENAEYMVELPEGQESYCLRFLDGFISKSWLDYLSFGEVSTGGWTDGDGIINCVKSSYDTESEDFTVSLLKHEAQHEADLRRYPLSNSVDLEYRAKLVELIYSCKRELLPRFALEADASEGVDGHGAAAHRIVSRIPAQFSAEQIRACARELFMDSCRDMEARNGAIGK